MLMSIRAYASEQLDALEPDVLAEVRGRHAAYFLALAEQARTELTGPQQPAWLIRLQVEHDNLRAALHWYRDHRATDHQATDALARLATSLILFWWIRGHYSEGQFWLNEARAGLSPTDRLSERVFSGLGTLAWVQGDYDAAQAEWERALTAARASEDDLKVASAMGNLAIVAMERQDLATAESLLTQALELTRTSGDPTDTAPPLVNLAVVLMQRADWAGAGERLREAVSLFRANGDHWRLATSLINLGDVQLAENDTDAAEQTYRESLRLAAAIEDNESVAYAIEGLAGASARGGDRDGAGRAVRAARLWGAAEALREVTGNPRPPTSGIASYADDTTRVRTELGAAAFATGWSAGRALTPAAAISEALDPS